MITSRLHCILVCVGWLASGLSGKTDFSYGQGQERQDREVIELQAKSSRQLHWYKGNLHTHTLWSDGDDFPEMVTDWYRSRDYHFLALSDHNVLSRGTRWMPLKTILKRGGETAIEKYLARFGAEWVEVDGPLTGDQESTAETKVRLRGLEEFRGEFEKPGEFLLIESEEITDKGVHINATNIAEVIQPQGGESFVDMVRNNLRAVDAQAKALDRVIIPHLNHPNLSDRGLTPEELAWLTEDRFFEVWNGVEGDGDLGSEKRHSLERLWDITSTLRLTRYSAPPLYGLATDDSHNYHGPAKAMPGRGWVMVQAEALTPESILGAMSRGNFYASTGVTLEQVEFDESTKRLKLRVAAQPGATYVIQFIGTRRGFDSTTRPRVSADTGEVVEGIVDYSEDIGEVLKTVTGLEAEYIMMGDELYVRAVVTSSLAPEFPTSESPFQKAWTQPVGWLVNPR